MFRSMFTVAACASAVLLAACGGMSGLGGSSTYGCRAPDGVRCDSLSGVYANAVAGSLPSQRQKSSQSPARVEDARASSQGAATAATNASLPAVAALNPIRTQPKILRVWIAPYEDTDGDLVDQQFVYMPINSGKWAVEHARRKIKESYAPARPVQAAGSTSTSSTLSTVGAAASATRSPDGSAREASKQPAPAEVLRATRQETATEAGRKPAAATE